MKTSLLTCVISPFTSGPSVPIAWKTSIVVSNPCQRNPLFDLFNYPRKTISLVLSNSHLIWYFFPTQWYGFSKTSSRRHFASLSVEPLELVGISELSNFNLSTANSRRRFEEQRRCFWWFFQVFGFGGRMELSCRGIDEHLLF